MFPKEGEHWSLTTPREKPIEIGANIVIHGRYVAFQMAEVSVSRRMFRRILSLIAGCARHRRPLDPVGGLRGMRTLGGVRRDDGKYSHQRYETAVVAGHGGKRSAPHSRIGLHIAAESRNGYSDAGNRRLSGKCRLERRRPRNAPYHRLA